MLLLLLVVYTAACALVFFRQRSMLYFPQAFEGGRVLDLGGGARVGATVDERPGPAAVIYFGGNAEAVGYSLPELQAVFPGQSLYLMHYRGYGATPGEPTEEGLSADALALYEYVRARHPQVTLVGRSLGSGVATRLASLRPADRLVLVTPYDSMGEVASHHFRWLPVRLLLRDRYDSAAYAPRINAPTTILAAERDEVIPRTSSEALYRSFRSGVATFHLVPGVGHNDISLRALKTD
ncbi:alpha/beta hydrolase [Pseudoduganella violaceinigra]|uniref:alpha/beta hydrolase n=1 Tax=Pseudoduganella violaceinigra TaxID=246602 RepID=UPI0003FA9221|nr:alpha/beta fold hydrolase [Pseudoduganella violaceinigra]